MRFYPPSALKYLAICVLVAGCGRASPTTTADVKELTNLQDKLEDSKRDKARIDAQQLTQAAQVYHVNNGEYPPTLESLTQVTPDGKPALLKPEALLDPWGKHYQYDPTGPKNEGKKPDIWTARPDGVVIGNWKDKK